MGIFAGRSRPLDVAQVRASGHGHLPVAPLLICDPVEGIVAVLHLIVHGKPLAFAVLPSPHILDHHSVAPLHIPVIRFCSDPFSVGRPHQHSGDLSCGSCNGHLLAGSLSFHWQIHVRSQLHAIPHGNHEGLGTMDQVWKAKAHLLPLA